MPRGGYRRPADPAPVSGPSALSRRTDGGVLQGPKQMTGGGYGESKNLQELQQGAPMAARSKTTAAPTGGGSNLPTITPLTAPTQRPDEPLTHGMPFGPGPNSVPMMAQQSDSLSSTLAKVLQNDVTGELSDLYDFLISRGL